MTHHIVGLHSPIQVLQHHPANRFIVNVVAAVFRGI